MPFSPEHRHHCGTITFYLYTVNREWYHFLCLRQRSGRKCYVFRLFVSLSVCIWLCLCIVLWDKDEPSNLGVKKSKLKVTVGSNMLGNALFDLVNAISWKLLDWISRNFQRWYTLGQKRAHQFWGQKVKGQGQSMIKSLAAEAYKVRCHF